MFPWLSDKRRYFPFIHMLWGDLKGYSQLPKGDGAYLMPVIPLAQFSRAYEFDRTLAKIRESIDGINRSFIGDLGDDLGYSLPKDKIKPVHYTLRKLASSDEKFNNWRKFIRNNEGIIPVLRVGSLDEMLCQAEDFADLGRGMVLRFRPMIQPDMEKIIGQIIKSLSVNDNLDSLLIIIDFENVAEVLDPAMRALNIIRTFMRVAGNRRLSVATCATSFPHKFEGEDYDIKKYPIIERQINQHVESILGTEAINLLYSDYASARIRAKAKTGGKGPPRIDYPTKAYWVSNRQTSHKKDVDTGYTTAAQRIVDSPDWEKKLQIYGANAIREAAEGRLDNMHSATSWVPVRINLHLHRQAHFYSNDEEFLGHESDWED